MEQIQATPLMTRRVSDGLLSFFHLMIEGESKTLEMKSARTAIGIGFPAHRGAAPSEYFYACLVAERVFPPRNRKKDYVPQPETAYVVIDEIEVSGLHDLCNSLIELKDKYLASYIFTPDKPDFFVDTLRAKEGLAFYDMNMTDEELWKFYGHFVDTDNSTGIVPVPLPGAESIQADIEGLLTTFALDPDTGQPVLDGEADPWARLSVFYELNTEKANMGLKVGMDAPEICSALWCATMGLERTRSRLSLQDSDRDYQRRGSERTGY